MRPIHNKQTGGSEYPPTDEGLERVTFLQHSGIKEKFLGGIPQAQKTIFVSSCATSMRQKPVRKNKETYTPPRKCQVRHIGCICVLPDAPSEQPDPRVLRSKILTPTAATQEIQNSRPNKQTPESYTVKASPAYLKSE